MSPLVLLFILCHITYQVQSVAMTNKNTRHLLNRIPIQPERQGRENEQPKKDDVINVHVNSKDKPLIKPNPPEDPQETQKKTETHPESPPDIKKKATQPPAKNESKVEDTKAFKPTEMESGALLRGVSVVVVLTTLVLIYMALRTYCGKRNKNPVMVSKYGVRTRRSDIEMTPLPLDDDEEDETLFEVHHPNRSF